MSKLANEVETARLIDAPIILTVRPDGPGQSDLPLMNMRPLLDLAADRLQLLSENDTRILVKERQET